MIYDYKKRKKALSFIDYIEIILVDYVGVVALFALVCVLTADVIILFNRFWAHIS